MKTKPNGFQNVFLLAVATFLVSFTSPCAFADGCFVAPKFVWNKYKDINEPAQKAIIAYNAGHEDLILQVKYGGPVDQFGWLIPVPAVPEVKKCSMKCFYELGKYTQSAPHGQDAAADLQTFNSGVAAVPPVTVIETKTAGFYSIAVLSARDAGALESWLAADKFSFPPGRAGVLDSYIQRHWCFVAVKINLRLLGTPKDSITSARIKNEMANGELNPLHIRFASDECVFPLKISSVNGSPSEVQVYVLSSEQLLEEGYPIKTAQTKRDEESVRKFAEHQTEWLRQRYHLSTPSIVHEPYDSRSIGFAQVTHADLPECALEIPQLQNGNWWLNRRIWTFQPEEMRDIRFLSAIPFLAARLGTDDGWSAARTLEQLGADAVPPLISAFESANSLARAQAACVLNDHPAWRPDLAKSAVDLLRDENPIVRRAAVKCLNANPEPQYASNYLALLDDPRPGTKAAALQILWACKAAVPEEILTNLLSVPRDDVALAAFCFLRDRKQLSCEEAVPLLRNASPFARETGLGVLWQNARRQSVEMALPFLQDTNRFVQMTAEKLLVGLTGRRISAGQWEKWWAENKDTAPIPQQLPSGMYPTLTAIYWKQFPPLGPD